MVLVSGANRHDSVLSEQCLEAIPALRGLSGRPRQRPKKLHADKGYNARRCRAYLKARGIVSRIARKGWRAARGWKDTAGWSSARTRGLRALAGCEFDLRGG